MTPRNLPPSARTLRALDFLNLFLADVRDGVGPYLANYLLATQHWNPASIAIALSAIGLATVIAQAPCGALIDALRQKRQLIMGAALLVGASCAAITLFPAFSFILSPRRSMASRPQYSQRPSRPSCAGSWDLTNAPPEWAETRHSTMQEMWVAPHLPDWLAIFWVEIGFSIL